MRKQASALQDDRALLKMQHMDAVKVARRAAALSLRLLRRLAAPQERDKALLERNGMEEQVHEMKEQGAVARCARGLRVAEPRVQWRSCASRCRCCAWPCRSVTRSSATRRCASLRCGPGRRCAHCPYVTRTAVQTKKRAQDLEKYKFVLDFKNQELNKELAPKEEALVQMAQRLNEMDDELQRNVQETDNMSILIKERDEKVVYTVRGDLCTAVAKV